MNRKDESDRMWKLSVTDTLINDEIKPVASKSISNRLLIIRALAEEYFTISNLSNAQDTKTLEASLFSLQPEVNAGEGGTTFRFLAAYLALHEGTFSLNAIGSMKNRTVLPLVEVLQKMGAEITYSEKNGFPPLLIMGGNLQGGEYAIPANISSQFISALLLIAPKLEIPLILILEGKIYSQPYISMTLQLMKEAGIQYEWKKNRITVYPGNYYLNHHSVESDWTAASYFYQIVALAKAGSLKLNNYFTHSVQGDKVIAVLMKNFGVETKFVKNQISLEKTTVLNKSFAYDFTDHPDLVMSMAVLCAALDVEGEFYGIDHLRIKESDRISALEKELKKINCQFIKEGDHWHLKPGRLPHEPVEFHTYNDHRMAMAFAPLALVMKEIKIRDPEVVNKSYPEFWHHLEKLGFEWE